MGLFDDADFPGEDERESAFEQAQDKGLLPGINSSASISSPAKNVEQSSLGRILGATASGAAGLGADIFSFARLTSGAVGAEDIESLAVAGHAVFSDLQQKYAPEDPTFPEKLAGAVGSSIGILLPAGAIARGAQVFKSVPQLAKYAGLIGASVSGVLEAAANSGGVFEANLAQGLSEEEARARALANFIPDALAATAASRVGLFAPKAVGPGARIARAAGAEFVQESIQEAGSQSLVGPGQFFDPSRVDPSAVAEAGVIGGTVGGLFGGGAAVLTEASRPAAEPAEAPAEAPAPAKEPTTVEEFKAEAERLLGVELSDEDAQRLFDSRKPKKEEPSLGESLPVPEELTAIAEGREEAKPKEKAEPEQLELGLFAKQMREPAEARPQPEFPERGIEGKTGLPVTQPSSQQIGLFEDIPKRVSSDPVKAFRQGRRRAEQALNRLLAIESRAARKRGVAQERSFQNKRLRRREELREAFVNLVREEVPKDQQGKFLKAVNRAVGTKSLFREIEKVRAFSDKVTRERLSEDIRSLSKALVRSPKVDATTKQTLDNMFFNLRRKKFSPARETRLGQLAAFAESEAKEGRVADFDLTTFTDIRELSKKPLEELDVFELTELRDKVRSLSKQGKLKLSLRLAQQGREMESLKKETVKGTVTEAFAKQEMRELGSDYRTSDMVKATSERYLSNLVALDRSLLPYPQLMKVLDGYVDNGPNQRIYKKAIFRRAKTYVTFDSVASEFNEVLRKNEFSKKELERISLFAYTQQEGGARKLRVGGVPEKLIEAARQPDFLSEKEMKLYKSMRVALDRVGSVVKPTAAAAFNINLRLQNNFFPWSLDYSKMDNKPELDTVWQRLEMLSDPWADNNQPKDVDLLPPGWTKTRKGGEQPIEFNPIAAFSRYMRSAIYIIDVADPIQEAQATWLSPEWREKAGPQSAAIMRDFVEILTNDGRLKGDVRSEMVRNLKANFGFAVLGAKFTSFAVQPTAFFDAGNILGVDNLTRGILLGADPRWEKWIKGDYTHGVSPAPGINKRSGDSQDWNDFVVRLERGEQVERGPLRKLQEASIKPLQVLDGYVARRVFLGGLAVELDKLGIKMESLDPAQLRETEAITEAITRAEELVVETQGSQDVLSQSPLSATGRVGVHKLFSRDIAALVTQFKNFMFRRWGQIRNQGIVPAFETSKGLYQVATTGKTEVDIKAEFEKVWPTLLWMIMAFAAEEYLRRLPDWFFSKVRGDEGDEEEVTALGEMAKIIEEGFGSIPILGDIYYVGKYRSSPIPALSPVVSAGKATASGLKAITQLDEGDTDNAARAFEAAIISAGEAVGGVAGLPGTSQASQIARKMLTPEKKKRKQNLFKFKGRSSGKKAEGLFGGL